MTQPNAIRPGDVVMLKGGGPRLTVSSVETVEGRVCALVDWFNEAGELQNHFFQVEALKHVSEDIE